MTDLRSFFAPKVKGLPAANACEDVDDDAFAVAASAEGLEDQPGLFLEREEDGADEEERLSYSQQWDRVCRCFVDSGLVEQTDDSSSEESHLLNPGETALITRFLSLNEILKFTLIRCFMRTHKVERIKNLAFASRDSLEALQTHFLRLNPQLNLVESINLLTRPELVSIAQMYRIPRATSLSVTALQHALLQNANSIASFSFNFNTASTPSQLSPTDILHSRVKAILGDTVYIPDDILHLFRTLFLVYNRDKSYSDNPFLVHIRSNLRTRRLHFMPYRVNKCILTWPTRADLHEFIDMCRREVEVEECVAKQTDSKDESVRRTWWEKIVELGESCVSVFENWMQEFPEDGHVSGIPWLSSYTAGHKSIALLKHVATAHKRLDNHTRACEIYALLLRHKIPGLQRGRGALWDEYMVALVHLGRHDDAYLAGLDALRDGAVQFGSRRSVEARLVRLSKRGDATRRMREGIVAVEAGLSATRLRACHTTVVIAEKTFSQTGRKALYMCPVVGEAVHVEQLALNEFEKLGYKGLHSENSVVTTLFGMLFWDILFDDSVPGVFASPFQDAPLDLGTEFFYLARRNKIDRRLENLTSGVVDDLDWQPAAATEVERSSDAGELSLATNLDPLHLHIISDIDAIHRAKATQCRGVRWNAFTRADILEIAACLTGPQVATLCRAFIESYGAHSGGVPDLCVWNAERREVKLVEVKGEGDTLSQSQIMWIDLMSGCGICVELFRVQLPNENGGATARRGKKRKS
ncbi:hypothetical protein BC830DRAFT_784768 [Chytriomyces sp. MP71]|nr:hypothetical protein BC830DRAFT_784768 [Chytriomyces sp. MP71]